MYVVPNVCGCFRKHIVFINLVLDGFAMTEPSESGAICVACQCTSHVWVSVVAAEYNSVAYSPDGGRIVGGINNYGTLKIWDSSGTVLRTLNGHACMYVVGGWCVLRC